MFGFNSRETFQDATYDVQTQKLNSPESTIETLVYRNGKIITAVRSDCAEDASHSSIQQRMSHQHEEILGKVREGTYELIFLWISRGIIAFESQDYVEALECLESVLIVEETHAEANAYLNTIQTCLEKDKDSRQRVLGAYQKQIEALEQSGRGMEASRKKTILTRICERPPPSFDRVPRQKTAERKRGVLHRSSMETLFSKTKETLLLKTRHDLLPRIRKDLLPHLRENLRSRYALGTITALSLMMLSGLMAADVQIELDPVYHCSLGKAYLEGNRLSSARNLFYGILRQDPDSQEAMAGFWETFEKKGDYQKAGELLEALLENTNIPPRIHFHLAEAYRLSSRCSEAVPYYQEALGRGSPEVPCKIGMGLCLIDQGNLTDAIDLWESLLQRGFEDYRIDYCLGTAYQARGRPGRASVHYTRALQKRPQSGPIYRSLGHCLYGMHQQEKAQRLWEKAAILESNKSARPKCPAFADPTKNPTPASLGALHACFPFPLI